MNKQEWFQHLENGGQVEKFIDTIIQLSKTDRYQSFFQNCGLYAVGSSLSSKKPNDVDITLVGLDFRAVFNYDGAHLSNPDVLIKEGIFVPGKTRYLNKEDEMKYDEEFYHYKDRDEGGPYDSFSIFDYIEPSEFILNLMREFGGNNVDSLNIKMNPFLRYETPYGDFLGSRCSYGEIDFMVHGENLLVPYWKEHQESSNLAYIILKEWKNSGIRNVTAARKLPRSIELPDYIDIMGKERSKITCNDLESV